MRDWRAWHRAYEDPSSSLSRRLTVVRRHVLRTLDEPRDMPIRVLSLCAGDGRDLLPVLSASGRPVEFAALVEQDPVLADVARRSAEERGLAAVTVITADAGDPRQFASFYPVDLLMLCGIFGNVREQDIQTTIAATPALLRDGGSVIWTRGCTSPDLRPSIRRWFQAAGLQERAFESEPAGYGVGVDVTPKGARGRPDLPEVLFRFCC